MKALRLYVFPDTETSILQIMRLGDKGKKQPDDIRVCQEYVKSILRERKMSE